MRVTVAARGTFTADPIAAGEYVGVQLKSDDASVVIIPAGRQEQAAMIRALRDLAGAMESQIVEINP